MEDEARGQPTEDLENIQKKQIEEVLCNMAAHINEHRKQCRCPSILIVEDDEFIKIITKAMLLNLGFDIQDVGNGALAVEAVEEQEVKCTQCEGFLIILMDYDMPVMNGLEAAKKIRSLVQEQMIRRIPIVAVSAFVSTQEVEKCLANGMCDYISKPFTWQRLYNALLKWMPIKMQEGQAKEENKDVFAEYRDN